MRTVLAILSLFSAAPAFASSPPASSQTVRTSNAEMTAIFAADQAARANPAAIDWEIVSKADDDRRKRVQELLDSGALDSGDDYYHAAFVFQHGDAPDDYLKAHALAIIAAARGKEGAAWIAAATLDRYLQKIGQAQIYGTQYLRKSSEPWTQEPYNRTLLSDAMRKATGVPEQSEQQARLADYAKRNP